MMNEKEFLVAFATLEAAFGTQNEARRAIYWQDFQDMDTDIESFNSACINCRRSCKRFPAIVELMEALPGHVNEHAAGLEAWFNVVKAALSQRFIVYNSNSGSTPTGEKLTDDEFNAVGGQRGLCQVRDASENPQQLGYKKLDFLELYKKESQSEARPLLSSRKRGQIQGQGPKRIGELMEVKG